MCTSYLYIWITFMSYLMFLYACFSNLIYLILDVYIGILHFKQIIQLIITPVATPAAITNAHSPWCKQRFIERWTIKERRPSCHCSVITLLHTLNNLSDLNTKMVLVFPYSHFYCLLSFIMAEINDFSCLLSSMEK